MDIRTRVRFELSRRTMRPPDARVADRSGYHSWRRESLSGSWTSFADEHVKGKDVLDFGCGDGQLALFLASEKRPRSVIGVDLEEPSIERARAAIERVPPADGVHVEFRVGAVDGLPVDAESVDTLIALDCLEHVMALRPVLESWFRVLRPGGSCLIEWYPYKGPRGPHMESLIPVPWAHVMFGENAMMRTAERIYDLPNFPPRMWDLDADGNKKPNKWRQWSSFDEQGYINKLDLAGFRQMVRDVGLEISRLDLRSFGGAPARRAAGKALMSLPLVGEYFVSFSVLELRKPETSS